MHIHVKVHVGGNVVHTGQLFFDDALTDTVFARKPYSTRGTRDLRNSQRLDLRERRQPVVAPGDPQGHRLPRHDHDGRAPRPEGGYSRRDAR